MPGARHCGVNEVGTRAPIPGLDGYSVPTCAVLFGVHVKHRSSLYNTRGSTVIRVRATPLYNGRTTSRTASPLMWWSAATISSNCA